MALRQILFIQGGGAGAHDEWDDKLVESLSRHLGDANEVRYPRMPDEDEPSYARWTATIQEEIDALEDGAIVVGHSVGGKILVNALAERPPQAELRAIVLIGAPFIGAGGWPGDEFELRHDLGTRLPRGVPVHVFHGRKTRLLRLRTLPVCECHPASTPAPTARARPPARQ